MYERKTKTKLIKNTIKVALATAVVFLIFSLSYSTNKPVDIAQAVDNPLISYTNISRTENNLDPLIYNQDLTQAAQDKAEDIFNYQYFEHISPINGKEPWDFIIDNDYDYQYAGENLAMGFDNYKETHEAWMNSQGHKKNILNKNYDEIGIGVKNGVFKGREVVVIVEMFGAH